MLAGFRDALLQLLDLLRVGGEGLETLPDIEGTEYREDHVFDEEGVEHGDNDDVADRGPVHGELRDARVQEMHEKERHRAPAKGRAEADVAAEVQRILAVIPPLHVEDVVHERAGDELERGPDQHAHQEGRDEVRAVGPGEDEEKRAAGTVDRKPRTVTEAAVHEAHRLQRAVGRLEAPAEDAVEHKKPRPLQQGVILKDL